MLAIPRITDGAKEAGRARSLKREFIQVELAEADGSRRVEPRDDFRILRGNTVEKDLTGRSGTNSCGIDVVLESDRDALQGAERMHAAEALLIAQARSR